jgi:competence protein ComEA
MYSSKTKQLSHCLRVAFAVVALGVLHGVAVAGPVDINRADAATIAKELQGIGAERAKAIVEYREKNGAFKSADELAKVKGIGAKVVEQNRANIRLSASAEPAKKP